MNVITSFFIWLSGADPDALQHADLAERRRYIKFGMAILIPTIMAWVGMFFTAEYLKIFGLTKYVACTIWALFILVIDLLMVSTMQRPEKWELVPTLRFLVVGIIRIGLSIVLGMLISRPIVIRWLEPEINRQLLLMEQQTVQQAERNIQDTIVARNRILQGKLDTVVIRINGERNFLDRERYGEQKGDYVFRGIEIGFLSGKNGEGKTYAQHVGVLNSLLNDSMQLARGLEEVVKRNKDYSQKMTDSIIENFDKGYEIREEAIQRLEKDNDAKGLSTTSFLIKLWLSILIALDTIPVIFKMLMPWEAHDIRRFQRLVVIKERSSLETDYRIGRMRVEATIPPNSRTDYQDEQVIGKIRWLSEMGAEVKADTDLQEVRKWIHHLSIVFGILFLVLYWYLSESGDGNKWNWITVMSAVYAAIMTIINSYGELKKIKK